MSAKWYAQQRGEERRARKAREDVMYEEAERAFRTQRKAAEAACAAYAAERVKARAERAEAQAAAHAREGAERVEARQKARGRATQGLYLWTCSAHGSARFTLSDDNCTACRSERDARDYEGVRVRPTRLVRDMDEGPTEFVEGVLALVGRTTATEVQGASALSRAELVVKAPTPGDLRIQRGKLKAQERADARSEGSKTFVWTCKRHGKTAFSASQGACETCISEGKVRRREALKTG